MSWFADLAGKAETLLNNLDEQTGAALRNHNIKKPKHDRLNDYPVNPDGNFIQKKRMIRNLRKSSPAGDTRTSSPSRKSSPTHQSRAQVKDVPEKNGVRCRKSPLRKNQFDLNNCPRTLVDDVPGDHEMMEHVGFRRRSSLPTELEQSENWMIHTQNLEVENAMLKNELNVLNTEVSELIDKCRTVEDGNDVVSSRKELNKTRIQLESSQLQNHRVNLDRDSLSCQLDMLKQRLNEINELKQNYMDDKQRLVTENCALKEANNSLEERLKEQSKKIENSSRNQLKMESDIRHAQTIISELQNNLERSNQECQRLDKDWAAYKLRVKSMLNAKDNEIKSLQDGLNLTEDAKVLVEQLESLKQEKEELSEALTSLRIECDNTKQYVTHLEHKWNASERVAVALRDTLQEERAARDKFEERCNAVSRELKNMQTETGQTISNLQMALKDKENEINNLRETSSLQTIDTSSLNVADYDISQRSIDHDKVQYLSECLVKRQARIDRLLADNNTLRIQLDKLECKHRSEQRNSHSVVTLHGESKNRRQNETVINMISYRIATVIRRHPLLRVLVIVYMICLHFWVMTVLFTSTPENVPRSSRT